VQKQRAWDADAETRSREVARLRAALVRSARNREREKERKGSLGKIGLLVVACSAVPVPGSATSHLSSSLCLAMAHMVGVLVDVADGGTTKP
jgi:hypothetical protein